MLTPSRIPFARTLAGLVFAAAITFSVSSFAADPGVDALIDTGVDRYKRHDYEGARSVFARAYELDPTVLGTLFDLALSELQSGHALDATGHLRKYLASAGAEPEKITSVRSKWLPQAESQIGRVSVEAPAGTEVSIDGSVVGTAPFDGPLDVAPGEHDLRAKLASGERAMHVSAGVGAIVSVRFVTGDAPTVPPPTGVPAAPGASIATPAADESPSPPSSGTPAAKIVTVAVIGGVAVAAAGVAIGFGVGSQNAENKANGLRTGLSDSACSAGQPSIPAACPQLATATSDQGRDFKLQLGFYAAGGALAVAAVTTWFLWPHPSNQSAWSIQPTFDAHSASAAVVGSF